MSLSPEDTRPETHRIGHESRAGWQMIAIGAACAAGIGVRVWQLVSRGNLWLDEAMLAQSIVDRSPRGLIFSPLEYHQVAPPGFLQLAKLSTLLFSPVEVALRLPSTIYSIAALLLFAVLAVRRLRNLEPFVAVVFLALSPLAIAYSAETKQYAGDLFFAVLISFVAIELRASRYSALWLRIAVALGLVAVWFSDTASIVLAGAGLALAFDAWLERDKRAARPALILGTVWAAAVIAAHIGARRRLSGGASDAMRGYWRDYFMPVPRSIEDAVWLPRTLADVYFSSLGLRMLGGVTIVLAIWGIIFLWRRGDRALAAIFFAPVVLALAASIGRLYPFGGRLTLFLVPAFAIALAAGMGAAGRLAKRWGTAVQLVLLVLLISTERVLAATSPLPWSVQEIEPVLSHVARNRRPGDRIYVYWGGVPAAIFYGERHGLTSKDFTAGTFSKDWKVVAADAAQLRGSSRVWLIFSHDLVPGLRDSVVDHLDSIGSRQGAMEYSAEGARVFLYDLRPVQRRVP